MAKSQIKRKKIKNKDITWNTIIMIRIIQDQKVTFKSKHSFQDRRSEAKRVLDKYPDRVPVICERRTGSTLGDIDKEKYLIPNDLTVGQFVYVIRKRLRLPAEKAIFLFVCGILPTISDSMNHLYNRYVDDDGFLYITYSEENVFG